jgi:hypothetical protein
MTNNSMSRPAILIDFKKDRIRIYKRTLHAIGDPEYILLLVNPEDMTIAILRGERSDIRSHRLPKRRFEDKQSFELYSKPLARDLLSMYDGWHDDSLYRIYGETVQSEGIAQFNIEESMITNGARG